MAYNGISPYLFNNNLTNVQLIDDISGSFNGSTRTFNLTVGGASYHAVSARSLIIVLGGIVQKPEVDYTVSTGQITFTVAPVSGLTFAARNIYGLNAINNVNDGVITPIKLSTGALTWTVGGNVGIGTANPQYKLDVNGTINITEGFYVNGTLVNLTSVDYGSITGAVDSSTDYGGLS
jgi:hypothetical protein